MPGHLSPSHHLCSRPRRRGCRRCHRRLKRPRRCCSAQHRRSRRCLQLQPPQRQDPQAASPAAVRRRRRQRQAVRNCRLWRHWCSITSSTGRRSGSTIRIVPPRCSSGMGSGCRRCWRWGGEPVARRRRERCRCPCSRESIVAALLLLGDVIVISGLTADGNAYRAAQWKGVEGSAGAAHTLFAAEAPGVRGRARQGGLQGRLHAARLDSLPLSHYPHLVGSRIRPPTPSNSSSRSDVRGACSSAAICRAY